MRCAFSLFPHSLYYMLLSLQCHFTKPHSSIELSLASQGSGSFTRSLRKLGARTLQCFDTWAYERGPRVAARVGDKEARLALRPSVPPSLNSIRESGDCSLARSPSAHIWKRKKMQIYIFGGSGASGA